MPPPSAPSNTVTRRFFCVATATLAAELVLGCALPEFAHAEEPAPGRDAAPPELNAWIVIAPDDAVIIRIARAEMGQGVLTSLAMLVAEELECEWAKVRPEVVRPEENARRNRIYRAMATGESRSVSGSQQHLRIAGATARTMLIDAAAGQWNVPAGECEARNGVVRHRPSGREARYGLLAARAAQLTPPKEVALKAPREWRLLGTEQHRLDAKAKVTGTAQYALDVRLPGMLFAAIVQCPVFKGRLRSVDDAAALGRVGVRAVVPMPDAVAVVADRWWQAQQALAHLAIDWDDSGNAGVGSDAIRADVLRALETGKAGVGRKTGDVDAIAGSGARTISATYEAPFLAHATMEPQNCTVRINAGSVEVWAPTQDAELTLAVAASAAGVKPEHVSVHPVTTGGGFGRRGMLQDYVRQAVLIAKAVGRPVQLIWSREEDIQHGFYRPITAARLTAWLDDGGAPLGLRVRSAGQSILAAVAPGLMRSGFDRQALHGFLDDMPYAIPHYRAEFAMVTSPVPVGAWRSLNYSQNVFFREAFVDEMAAASGMDAFAFRRNMLAGKPRHLAVLDAAAQAAGWSQPLPPGRARGLAFSEESGTICAEVVEVSVGEGTCRVERVVCAIDAGHIIDPRGFRAQVEGAIIFGLTAAFHGEITIEAGRAVQSNFHDYEMLHMAQTPRIDCVIVGSDGWGGAGEPPLPPVAPALCNAVFAATGRRIRALPLARAGLRPG